MPADDTVAAVFVVSPVRGQHGLHLRLVGELDIATAGQLGAATATLTARDLQHLCLDLTDLEFLDAAGLRALLATRALVAEHGGQLVLTGVRPLARRVLEITGLEQVLNVHGPSSAAGWQ